MGNLTILKQTEMTFPQPISIQSRRIAPQKIEFELRKPLLAFYLVKIGLIYLKFENMVKNTLTQPYPKGGYHGFWSMSQKVMLLHINPSKKILII